MAICVAALSAPAVADEYDQDQAGHPLRIAAYVLHPIGWFLDYFIFEPFHKIGNSPPGRVIFGHRDDFQEVKGSAAERKAPAAAPTEAAPDPTPPIDDVDPAADDEV